MNMCINTWSIKRVQDAKLLCTVTDNNKHVDTTSSKKTSADPYQPKGPLVSLVSWQDLKKI